MESPASLNEPGLHHYVNVLFKRHAALLLVFMWKLIEPVAAFVFDRAVLAVDVKLGLGNFGGGAAVPDCFYLRLKGAGRTCRARGFHGPSSG